MPEAKGKGRRRWLARVAGPIVAAFTLGYFGASAALADDVGESYTTYKTVTVGSLLRCASRQGEFYHAYDPPTVWYDADTISQSTTGCDEAYSVAAGNIWVEVALWRWNEGTAELCDYGGGSWNGSSGSLHSEFGVVEDPAEVCGAGDFQTFHGHTLYMGGTPYSSNGNSGIHTFK